MIADVKNRITPKKCSFKCLQIKEPVFAEPFHKHSEIEITHIVSSDGRRILGNHVGNFQAGDLVMIGSDLPHMYYTHPDESLSPTWAQAQVIQFNLDFMGKRFFKLSKMDNVESMLLQAKEGLKFFGETKTQAIAQMQHILSSRGPKRLNALIEMLNHMSSGGQYKSLCKMGNPVELNHKNEITLQNIILRITQDFSLTANIENITEIYGMTPMQIDALFYLALDVSYNQFLNQLRLAHASRLLRETNFTISKIATRCGFLNSPTFITIFREYKKITPLHFRKNVYIARPKPKTESKKRGWGKVRKLW